MSTDLAVRPDQLPVVQLGNDVDDNDDLSAGVTGGFPVLSIKGSKWKVKHGGEETVITNEDGDAKPSIRVLMLKANRHITKNYYTSGYVEGSTDAPDCFSSDGKKPDASVEDPVSPSCANCPMNVFGSRITDTGSKAKACSDQRRVAVLPEGDYANELYGGPMLLRVPAASLSDLANYGKHMKAKGFPYNSIITKLAFDSDAAYPKIKFQAARPLQQAEADQINALIADPEFMAKVENVLANPVEVSEGAPAGAPAPAQAEDPYSFADEAAPPATPAPSPEPNVGAEAAATDEVADLEAAAKAAEEAAAEAKKKAAAKKAAETRAANKAKKEAEAAAAAQAATPTPPPAPTPTPTPAEETAVSDGDELGDDLNDILASLEDLN